MHDEWRSKVTDKSAGTRVVVVVVVGGHGVTDQFQDECGAKSTGFSRRGTYCFRLFLWEGKPLHRRTPDTHT